MNVTIVLTIEQICSAFIRVSVGGEDECTLPISRIEYNEEEMEVGAEIEITMPESLATDKGLV